MAETLLYQPYQQNEQYEVTGINQAKLLEVVTLCGAVISSDKYGLAADFGDNFLGSTENGTESVFAIQYSKSDGSTYGRINMWQSLVYPMNKEFGCYWQHIPSQNLVNSFKTDATGLPKFADYNTFDAIEGNDFLNQTFDPSCNSSSSI